MAASSLESASKYLNNLLLARGLLQDGRPIDFTERGSSKNAEANMSRVINLVHELVLRRDRDADQREALANNIRSMRAEENQRVLDLQKVQDKNGELFRTLATAEAQQRSLKVAAQRAEQQAKELKEQMLKMKSTLDQVRAKCISDVRKRDVELEKLKSHLNSMQRGKREASGMKVNIIRPQPSSKAGKGSQDVNSTDWSLEKETNDFLAAIVNETSSENVILRKLISDTMETLRDLTGVEPEPTEEDNAIGIPGQYRRSADSDSIIPCVTLQQQMSEVLSRCQAILKDPSFVPIEEVHLRDEEIIKLRIGWEKMASRWKEAVTMMNNWRQKVLEGDEVMAEDLSDLSFGRSIAVLPNGEPVLGTVDEEEPSAISEEHNGNHDQSEVAPSIADDRFDEDSDLDIPPEPSAKRLAASPARRGIKLPHPPLQEISNTTNQPHIITPSSSIDSLDGIIDENTRPISRIPRQTKKAPQSPPMTVSEKLKAIEADAVMAEAERNEEVTHKRKPKQKRVDRARRRSTLSPEELAALMGAR
ncbi:uncharacterized protein AB675_3725 [Cyphellophora attinorum]|uniref:NIMA interactive protein n=1 Tax=Cyphellophora attinorum TaxID=1664694 RepID=A0A0N1H5N9_9EURO|nr:uncharacterized protein AB675_3725 [Phialophora attinorum]KPI37134.1 hypothetical protein AB675_3725 [Phialophora attinorum]